MARCLKQTKVGKYVLYFADVSINTGINIPGESPFIKDEEKGYMRFCFRCLLRPKSVKM